MYSHHKKIRHLGLLVTIILLLISTLFLFESGFFGILPDRAVLEEWTTLLGFYGPILIIALQTVQTTISIFPSQITTVAAGYIFGPLLGFIYSLIGSFFGSTIVFFISKKYGHKITDKFFDKKEMLHFQSYFQQKGPTALFLARIVPIFPNDLVSFAAGLTDMNYWRFTTYSTFGFLVQMIVLSYFGAELAKGIISSQLIMFAVLIVIMFILVLFRNKIKKVIIKDFHKIEKKLEKEIRVLF